MLMRGRGGGAWSDYCDWLLQLSRDYKPALTVKLDSGLYVECRVLSLAVKCHVGKEGGYH